MSFRVRPAWLLPAALTLIVAGVLIRLGLPSFGTEQAPPGSETTPPGSEATPSGSEATRPGTEATRPGEDRTVIAYVPYWDQQRGFDSLLEHLELFDEVSPFWYSLDSDGSVVLADPAHTTVDRQMVRHLQQNDIAVIPTITNLRYGDWDYEVIGEVLNDPATRDAHIRNIVDLVMREGYDGIDLDYESMRAEDREVYSVFLRQLSAALHAEGKVLTSSVHPKTDDAGYDERNVAQDFQAIGEAVDQVRVMAYDYHWSTSAPGPGAPADWVEEVIAWTVTQIPSEKVVLGAVLLGYDWVDEHGETVDYQQAMSRIREKGAELQRDDDHTPWYRYTDDAGREHSVWFEDGPSVNAKLGLVKEYDLGGMFFWRLGGEDPHIWRTLPDHVPRGEADS